MATSALLGTNYPLTSWKQASPILLSRLRRLPSTKTLQFNATTPFKLSSSSSVPYDLIKPQFHYSSTEKTHFTSSDHEDNPKEPLGRNIFDEKFSNIPLKRLTTGNALSLLRTPAMAAALFGLLLFTVYPNSSLAASGGVCGGSDFSSSSDYSCSSDDSSSSYSSWSTSSDDDDSGSYSSSASSSSPSSSSSSSSSSFPKFILILGLIILALYIFVLVLVMPTIVKLQVGLLGSARTLQKDLDRVAETADTSTRAGLSYVLREATMALLRHPDYWISSYSFVTRARDMKAAESCFKKFSAEERAKFDEETLVNLNNKKGKISTTKTDNGFRNEYIVVTLLVAVNRWCALPTIRGVGDLKKALQNLGSIPPDAISAVQVLWTPQQENDTLSEEELIEDYPLLKPLA